MEQSGRQRVAWEGGAAAPRRRLAWRAGLALAALLALGLVAGPPALQALRAHRAAASAPAPGPLRFDATFPPRHGDPFARPALDAALAQARDAGRPVLLYFSAEWCTPCQELDAQTFPAHAVGAAAARFTRLKVDATDTEDEAVADVLAHYGVDGLPTVVFVDARGVALPAPRVTGFLDAQSFADELQRVP